MRRRECVIFFLKKLTGSVSDAARHVDFPLADWSVGVSLYYNAAIRRQENLRKRGRENFQILASILRLICRVGALQQ